MNHIIPVATHYQSQLAKNVENMIDIFGDRCQLVGDDLFVTNVKFLEKGINPATKEKIQIAAKKVAKFKAGAELADAINA